MISGIEASNAGFLADLNQIQTRITQANKEVSSGIRVAQASDDPGVVSSILHYQGEIDRITQIQSNLNTATTVATAADSALQNASALLDRLVSLGAEGANSTATSTTQAGLAQQVQQIAQQLVSLANTSVEGQFIFAGNATGQPYTFTGAAPKGVTQNSTAQNTAILRDASGNQIVPNLTAEQVFDIQDSNGASVAGNVFQAVYDLGAALQTNDQSAIAAATDEIKAAVTQIGAASQTYGNVEKWIQNAQSDASTRLVNLQQALSVVRDADIPTVATQLTTDQTALQAALSAHASASTKSLFSFLG